MEQCHFLFKDEGAGLSSSYAAIVSTIESIESMVLVYVLQDGVWCMHTVATTSVPYEQLQEPLLVDNKICILSSLSGILVLDLMAFGFSKIQLPQGMVCGKRLFTIHLPGLQCGGRTMLSRADDDSGVHLIHVNELQLGIWLHKGDRWLLVDSICLREMCGGLLMLDCVLGAVTPDEDDAGLRTHKSEQHFSASSWACGSKKLPS